MMKKILFIITCVLISGLSLQSCKKSDGSVKTDVDKVLQEQFSSSAISSTVKDGVVTLAGVVESEAEKVSIENAVKNVKGIKNLNNNITVQEKVITPPEPVYNDAAIKSSIESKLTEQKFKTVKVEVKEGEVILTGDLKRADLTKVMQIANESNPKKVTNNLNLK